MLVLERHCRDHQIATVWHPEAAGEVLESANLGNIRVLVGEPGYQLNTGEMVKV